MGNARAFIPTCVFVCVYCVCLCVCIVCACAYFFACSYFVCARARVFCVVLCCVCVCVCVRACTCVCVRVKPCLSMRARDTNAKVPKVQGVPSSSFYLVRTHKSSETWSTSEIPNSLHRPIVPAHYRLYEEKGRKRHCIRGIKR